MSNPFPHLPSRLWKSMRDAESILLRIGPDWIDVEVGWCALDSHKSWWRGVGAYAVRPAINEHRYLGRTPHEIRQTAKSIRIGSKPISNRPIPPNGAQVLTAVTSILRVVATFLGLRVKEK